MAKTIFITGGARSGKSTFALKACEGLLPAASARRAFIATLGRMGEDAEMLNRIEAHAAERGSEWETFEEPIAVPALIRRLAESHDAAVVDCLTLWLSNLMHAGRNVEAETGALLAAIRESRFRGGLVIVSNEVGLGIVPANDMARLFRDLAGTINRKVAEAADEAYLMAAGIPLCLKK